MSIWLRLLIILIVIMVVYYLLQKFSGKENNPILPELDCTLVLGNYPYPHDCSLFYMCLGFNPPLLLPCPDGFYYDIEFRECRLDNVDCGNRPILRRDIKMIR
ncbi:hypothetical protein [Mocis latipes granulovirus]|uniref:Chitin-binding type-2 domain-containing protein n=1 Tax=Mocis latipes granulovirus TaxID=2072024 RepID=A0A162GV96_9BBAC|nr:hypothetical protein [Mocis latipes granulovirus]AKR17404.1 hypothetical protein [Mocis latipes granulovirus]